jgi:hypothetical protein
MTTYGLEIEEFGQFRNDNVGLSVPVAHEEVHFAVEALRGQAILCAPKENKG